MKVKYHCITINHMNLYKVYFDNDGAVSGEQLPFPHPGSVKIESVDGRQILKWITIHADSEVESMQIADSVVNNFFQFRKVG